MVSNIMRSLKKDPEYINKRLQKMEEKQRTKESTLFLIFADKIFPF